MTTIADHAAIAVQNSALHAETERQLAEMTALHRTAAILNSSLDRAAVLHTIVEQAAQVTGARVCGLLELTSTGDATIPRAIYGMDHFPFKDVAILQHGPALYAIQQRAPLIVRSREEALTMPWWRREYAEDVEHGPSEAFDAKGFIAVPFGYQGACNAVLMLVYDHPINPSASELELISTFADHAAVAMHNALLYEQAQQAAALEERHRLARDLHDSVTQSLFSMSLLAQALPRPLDSAAGGGDAQPRRTAAALERGVGGDARPALPVAPRRARGGRADRGAPPAHRVAPAPDGPALTFVATGSDERMPLPIEEGLFRIANEAVGNALKTRRRRTSGDAGYARRDRRLDGAG